jgi:hypothetical protein
MSAGKGLLLLLAVLGCLPEDTRPPPGRVTVTFRGSDSTIDGVTTSDGWNVRFDRVFVTIGGADVEGEGCTEYADADYFRILNGLSRTPQKVGLMYGLGTCSLEVRARNPEVDTLIGEGITEADKFVMREPGTDVYEQNSGITFWIRGRAERMGVSKSFDWRYRRRRVRFARCEVDGVETFALAGEAEKTIEVRVHAPVLFQDHIDPKLARLRFDPIAAADLNTDGVVTFEEMEKVSLKIAGIDLRGVEGAESIETLGELVYQGSFPQLLRVGETGLCNPRPPPRP